MSTTLQVQPLVAGALAELGAEHAWVVHSDDGLDELSVNAATQVTEVRGGRVERQFTVDPVRLGIGAAAHGELAGGDAAENAGRIRAILSGRETSAAALAVALNAAATLVVAGQEEDLRGPSKACRACLSDGQAAAKLDSVVRRTREAA